MCKADPRSKANTVAENAFVNAHADVDVLQKPPLIHLTITHALVGSTRRVHSRSLATSRVAPPADVYGLCRR